MKGDDSRQSRLEKDANDLPGLIGQQSPPDERINMHVKNPRILSHPC